MLAMLYWKGLLVFITKSHDLSDSMFTILEKLESPQTVFIYSFKTHFLVDGAEYRNITLRRNEVTDTGGTGECFYLGTEISANFLIARM